MKLFARVRYYYEKAAGYMKTTPMTLTYKQKEQLKAHYNDTIIVQNLITVAAIAFSSRVQFPVSARTFKDSFMELNESNEINTFTIYDKL